MHLVNTRYCKNALMLRKNKVNTLDDIDQFFTHRRRTETTSIHMHLAVAEAFAIFFFLIAYAANGIKV